MANLVARLAAVWRTPGCTVSSIYHHNAGMQSLVLRMSDMGTRNIRAKSPQVAVTDPCCLSMDTTGITSAPQLTFFAVVYIVLSTSDCAITCDGAHSIHMVLSLTAGRASHTDRWQSGKTGIPHAILKRMRRTAHAHMECMHGRRRLKSICCIGTGQLCNTDVRSSVRMCLPLHRLAVLHHLLVMARVPEHARTQ